MGACVYAISFLPIPDWLTLIVQILLGAVIYVLGSKLCRIDSYTYIKTTAKSLLKKRKRNPDGVHD